MMTSRRGQIGQALVEMAIVIPILLTLTMGFIGVGVMVESRTQVQAALTLATASATQAPLGDQADALRYAENTFFETMSQQNWITAKFGGCTAQGYFNNSCVPASSACTGSYMSGVRPGVDSKFEIHCKTTNVAILFSKIGPLTMLWPLSMPLGSFNAVMFPSTYRSCFYGQRCS